MNFTIKRRIGADIYEFTQTAVGPKDFFNKASFFTDLPRHCGNSECGPGQKAETTLQFHARGAKTAAGKSCTYYEISCSLCNWRKPFGQNVEGDGLFPKDWEAPYVEAEDRVYDGPPPPQFAEEGET